MRNPLQRNYGQGDLHFVTFSCCRRKPLLGTAWARDRFVEILDEIRRRHGFRLIGYVVMPEHVHLLISESGLKNPSKILQVLKQKAARTFLEEEKRKKVSANSEEKVKTRTLETEGCGTRSFPDSGGEEETHFWQRRFYDFNVWSEEKLKEKLAYMHANPVQRRLVEHPRDWPWSSWANYSGRQEPKIRVDFV